MGILVVNLNTHVATLSTITVNPVIFEELSLSQTLSTVMIVITITILLCSVTTEVN